MSQLPVLGVASEVVQLSYECSVGQQAQLNRSFDEITYAVGRWTCHLENAVKVLGPGEKINPGMHRRALKVVNETGIFILVACVYLLLKGGAFSCGKDEGHLPQYRGRTFSEFTSLQTSCPAELHPPGYSNISYQSHQLILVRQLQSNKRQWLLSRNCHADYPIFVISSSFYLPHRYYPRSIQFLHAQ